MIKAMFEQLIITTNAMKLSTTLYYSVEQHLYIKLKIDKDNEIQGITLETVYGLLSNR